MRGASIKMIPQRITIHCSDSANGAIYSIEQLEKDHIARGFGGIGYHFVIEPDGTKTQTRPFNESGCHVKGHNTGNIGICLIGKDKFTDIQFSQLRAIIDQIISLYGIKKHELYCHYEWDTAREQWKTCPNIPIKVFLSWYLAYDHEAIKSYTYNPNAL